jgi:hypothetical protein
MKNLETYDVKHQNPRLGQNVTYLRNYEAIDLRKKKRTIFMNVMKETFEIAQSKY